MHQTWPLRLNFRQNALVGFAVLAFTVASITNPAWAGRNEAETAITRADAKIEVVSRQVGQAGMPNVQGFTLARERLNSARQALQQREYDSAEMMANEASLLTELGSEQARLEALKTSYENVSRTAGENAPLR
ncbi:MAG: hypothetical protein WEB93_00580 [Sphingomonadales bacterium]